MATRSDCSAPPEESVRARKVRRDTLDDELLKARIEGLEASVAFSSSVVTLDVSNERH